MKITNFSWCDVCSKCNNHEYCYTSKTIVSNIKWGFNNTFGVYAIIPK